MTPLPRCHTLVYSILPENVRLGRQRRFSAASLLLYWSLGTSYEGRPMSKLLHVCVIGAGSSYTPELIEGFINRRDELDLRSIRFVDIDRRRLDILANMAERMFRYAGLDVPILRYED